MNRVHSSGVISSKVFPIAPTRPGSPGLGVATRPRLPSQLAGRFHQSGKGGRPQGLTTA